MSATGTRPSAATPSGPSPATPSGPASTAPAARPISFGTLVRVEWGKATDTRSARWLLAIAVVATLAITLVPLLAKTKVDQDWHAYAEIVTTPLSILLPIVAILALTSEWTQRTVLTTFVQQPRRLRVLSAKLTVSVLLALVGAVFTGLVVAGALAVADSTGRTVDTSVTGQQLAGLVGFAVITVLSGAAFGAVLQNSAAAIVLSLVLPTAIGIFGAFSSWVHRWLDVGYTSGLVLGADGGRDVGGIVFSIAVWVVLPLAAGAWRYAAREVK